MTGKKKLPLWWRILAYLPEGPLFIECATCLFWRGVAVGATTSFLSSFIYKVLT